MNPRNWYWTRDKVGNPFEDQEEFEYEEVANFVRKHRPEHSHTLDWDEHPEDHDGECYCQKCLDRRQ